MPCAEAAQTGCSTSLLVSVSCANESHLQDISVTDVGHQHWIQAGVACNAESCAEMSCWDTLCVHWMHGCYKCKRMLLLNAIPSGLSWYAGLVSAVGRSNAPSCLQLAGLGHVTSASEWQELLRRCKGTDHLLNQLLNQRDQALHACLVTLQVRLRMLRSAHLVLHC